MSVSGDLNSTITVVAIEIDGLVAVTEVDAEQTGCIITYVVVVLDFQQVIRVQRLVLAVAEGMLILPPALRGRNRPRTSRTAVPDLDLQQHQHRPSTGAWAAWPCLLQRRKTRRQAPTCTQEEEVRRSEELKKKK